MAKRITKNDIPGLPAIKEALLAALASGRSRSFSNIGSDVAKALGLTRGQRAYRIGKSKETLFQNRLVQARAELTKEGAISYRSGKVRLERHAGETKPELPDAPHGSDEGRAVEIAPIASAPDEATAIAAAKASPGNGRKHPEGRPTICLSFQQPWASCIATGMKTVEFRSRKVNVPIENLVVCASKTMREVPAGIPGMAYGLALGMVDVVACRAEGSEYAWKLDNPRLIKPLKVKATAAFFYVADIPEVIPSTEEAYREFILPHCLKGAKEDVDEAISALFSLGDEQAAQWLGLRPEDQQW